MAVGERLEPFDSFASPIGAGAFHRYKTDNRTPMLGDRKTLASSDPFEQSGEMSLRLVGTNIGGHAIFRLVLH